MRINKLTCALSSVLLLTLAAGCQRKAPGPRECQRFALRLLQIQDARALKDPRVASAVERATNECLTTPYDRKLLGCVERGQNPNVCAAEFRLRRPKR